MASTTRILLVALLLSGAALAQQPVGMVLNADGEAEITRAGDTIPATLAALMYPEDQVRARGGQMSFVFCPTESMVSLDPGSAVRLTGTGIDPLEGPAPIETPSPCALPQVELGSESMERIGALRGRGYPPIELYFGGQVSQTRPEFVWGAIDDAESYHLTLTAENGSFVWEVDTVEPIAVYPESMAALEEGSTYRWEVSAEAGGEVIAQQSASFNVQLDATLPEATDGIDLVRAVALENAGYYSEAAQIYRQFREDGGDRIGQRLAWLYWNSGLIAAANTELDQLP